MSSILVTGGSGFIGRHFCRSAVDRGMSVTVLTRNKTQAVRHLPASVTSIERLSELDGLAAPQTLLNLAGEGLADGRWTQRRKQKFYDSRIGTTERLVAYFSQRQDRPEQVISGSAIGYYGSGNAPVDESGAPVDGFSHQLCDTWEQSAQQFAALGSRVCYLRTGIVLGDQGALARMLPAFKLGLGGPMGSGEQWMSWIHIDDMIAAIHHCIENRDITGPVNATAPNPVTNADFSATLAAVLKRPGFLRMPAVVVKLLFGEMGDELLLHGQNVVPAKLLASGFTFTQPELHSALAALLSNPT